MSIIRLEYLVALYSIDSGVVVSKIEAIARKRNMLPEQVLARLWKSVPGFAEHVAEDLGRNFHRFDSEGQNTRRRWTPFR